MNISKKFLISAVLLLGILTGILIANAVIVHRIKNAAQDKNNITLDSIKAAIQAENALKLEIISLKDRVLFFNNQKSRLNTYQSPFVDSLKKLEIFMPNDPDINLIRRRYTSLINLDYQLLKNGKKT
ncbi:MAG: hypothetical protein ACKO3K_04725 [Cuspidothrix sp.]